MQKKLGQELVTDIRVKSFWSQNTALTGKQSLP